MYTTLDITNVFPFNGQLIVAAVNGYPEFPRNSLLWASYGVVDSIDQFKDKFGKQLDDDLRTFVVCFTHVAKEPELAGQGGGWRWRKWGPYFGKGMPTCEYIDDEQGFDDGVWTFQILQTTDAD